MKRIAIAVIGMALLSTFAAAQTGSEEKLKALFKTYHLNPFTVVVTCKDSSKPKVEEFTTTHVVFVSCGE